MINKFLRLFKKRYNIQQGIQQQEYRDVEYVTYKATLEITTNEKKIYVIPYVTTIKNPYFDPIEQYIREAFKARVFRLFDTSTGITTMLNTHYITSINYNPDITIETIKELVVK